MNKVVAILGIVVVVGSALPDLSSADKHAVLQEKQETRSLMLAGPDESMRPPLRGEELSQRAQQSSWNCVGLTHTDPHHLFGNESSHRVVYRNSQMADGGAIMFRYVFKHP